MTNPTQPAEGMPELLPCPWCGAGETQLQENGRQWLGQRYSEPISVSVRHWCEPVDGQPNRMIERIGRDRASAIAAWNTRASPKAPPMPELPEAKIRSGHIGKMPTAAYYTADQMREYARQCVLAAQGFTKE